VEPEHERRAHRYGAGPTRRTGRVPVDVPVDIEVEEHELADATDAADGGAREPGSQRERLGLAVVDLDRGDRAAHHRLGRPPVDLGLQTFGHGAPQEIAARNFAIGSPTSSKWMQERVVPVRRVDLDVVRRRVPVRLRSRDICRCWYGG
jgi:hypothetical protein